MVVLTAWLVGCNGTPPPIPGISGETSVDTVTPPSDVGQDLCPDPTGITYQREIRPLLMIHCFDCHSEIDGKVSAGVSYDWSTWDNVWTYRYTIQADVKNRIMPPWPMAPDCRKVQNSRALDQATIDVFQAWEANEFCKGDPADFVDPGWQPTDTNFSDADLTTAPATAWTLPDNIAQEDEFRCYKLDVTFDEDVFLSATATSPGSPLSHHALIYLSDPETEPLVDAKDAKYDGEGWGDCETGIGVNAKVVAGWVPSMGKSSFPSESAMLIPAGSRLVMQMHYSGVGATAEELQKNTDQTQFHMWLLPTGTTPKRLVKLTPISKHNFSIPLETTETVFSTQTVQKEIQVFAVVSHMHFIGTETRLTLQQQGGGEECISDIPQWDFDWQLIYLFEEDDQVTIKPGDTLKLECTFPYEAQWVQSQLGDDAPDPLPDKLIWGENSYNEMCISYFWYTVPYVSGVTFMQCAEACTNFDPDCVLDCIIHPEVDTKCVVGKLQACGGQVCTAESTAFFSCLSDCTLGSPLNCVRNTQVTPPCEETYQAFIGCLGPELAAGTCELSACD